MQALLAMAPTPTLAACGSPFESPVKDALMSHLIGPQRAGAVGRGALVVTVRRVDLVDSAWYGTPRSSRPPSLVCVFIGGGHNKPTNLREGVEDVECRAL